MFDNIFKIYHWTKMNRFYYVLILSVFLLVIASSGYGEQVELRGVYMELTESWQFGVLPVVPDGDWRRLCRELKVLGINTVFPNVVSTSGAIYPSEVVGMLPSVKKLGGSPKNDAILKARNKLDGPSSKIEKSSDFFEKLIKVAHAEGLEVHAWTNEWYNAPKNIARDRLVHDLSGETTNSLCPSQSENRELMRRMVIELVTNYDIDGIQYDTMRFPSAKYCYCKHCREGFEKSVGSRVLQWPTEVLSGGRWEKKYLDYLYGTLNSFVREMYPLVKKIKPKMVVSAAVWPREVGSEVPSVRQDWGEWVRDGVLDFIVPMNYGNDWIISHYEEFARNEAKQVAGKIPLIFGLGAYSDTPLGIVSAVKLGRDLKGDGFIIYTLTKKTFFDHLPMLHQIVWQEPASVPRFGRR